MNEAWTCPHCLQTIYGSLAVVLVLASAHRCNDQAHSLGQTVCLECRQSPTGLCVYHTRLWLTQDAAVIGTRTFYKSN